MTAADRAVGLLGTLLARRERDRSPVRTARVLGRHQDGTERVLRTDAVCVTRAPVDNHYSGSVVTTSALAPFHREGTSGLGRLETFGAETLWIESLEPAAYEPGRTYTVTVHGRGFDTRVRIDFLLPDDPDGVPTINGDIEVLGTELVDTETLILQISVAPGARLYPSAPIAYGRI